MLFMKRKIIVGASMLCFSILLLFYSSPIIAQNIIQTLHGKVVDGTGKPLSGASVSIKGQSQNTSTDTQGEFTLQHVKTKSTVVVSYVGYIDKETVVNSDADLSVTLVAGNNDLNDVVVIGYGTAKRKEVVGSVNVVAAKDAGATTSTNPSQLLIGKAAGVQVVQTNGVPGADAQIIIRGTGSFTSVDPLYVIDGIQGDKNLFNSLSSQDIDNITILKDASSTAIYGSAAANGVVIITTKKGRNGAPRISVTSQWGMAKAWKQLDILNAAQYVDLMKDFAATSNTTLPPKFNTPAVLVDSNNWQKQIFQTALVSENDVNISGGTDKVLYAFSAGYITQQGTVKDIVNKRFNSRFALEETFGRFRFGQALNLRYTRNDGQLGSITDALGYAPYKPVYDPNIPGGYSIVSNVEDFSNVNNPLQTFGVKRANSREYVLFPQLFAEVGLVKGLKFRTQLSASIGGGKSTSYQYPYEASNYLTFSRQATLGYNDYSYYNFENYLSYNNTFGKHAISAILGTSYQSAGNTASINGTGSNIPNDVIQNISVSPSQTVTGSYYNYARPAVISYYGRLSYTFDEKYILSASMRRDGASNFGANNRFGDFPGLGAAWRFADENFIKGLNIFSDGKIRVGWGRTGNNNIPNFQTAPYTFSGSPSGNLVYSFGTNEAFNTGTTIVTITNPDLQWEQTNQTDVGLELGFLKNKLTISADWYKRKSSGLLVAVPIPGSVGASLSAGQPSKTVNAADAENKGVEFMVTWRDNLSKEFNYTISVNGAFNKNNVLSLGSQFTAPIQAGSFSQLSTFTYTAPGSAIGSFYGYRKDHVARDQAEIDALNKTAAAKTGNPDAKFQDGLLPGDFIFKDLNGDGVVNASDQEILGNPIPKFVYGLNAGLSYKGFDLNLVLSGVSGLKLLNAMRFNTVILATGHNATTDILDRWKKPGDVAGLPRVAQNANASGNLRASDWWLEDGSYLRLRNITIGYTISSQTLNSVTGKVFNRVRFYVAAQNLFTITNYSGYDPEVSTQSGGAYTFTRGIDDGQFPQPRTFIAGVQLGF